MNIDICGKTGQLPSRHSDPFDLDPHFSTLAVSYLAHQHHMYYVLISKQINKRLPLPIVISTTSRRSPPFRVV